ncbi:MAG: hypothetical protein JNJ73_13905 [Hyphomonadaceae bacterium]|nr:hypothetical protein [Hyphomonadaceae bacterium]
MRFLSRSRAAFLAASLAWPGLAALVLAALAFVTGPALADMRAQPAECRAAEAQIETALREAPNWQGRVEALRRLAPNIPPACEELKTRTERILRSLTEAQAAPVDGPSRGMGQAFALPDFPWPPPTPSARLVMPRAPLVAALPASQSLYDVGERLTGALLQAGYSEYSFFAAPKGFALTARLERIRDDGTPAPEEFRFLEPSAEEPFSLTSYVSRLFFAPEGFYRQIVFVVTDQPFVASAPAPTTNTADEWLRRGATSLPDGYRRLPFGPGYNVTALVYEFRKGARDRDVATLTPGRLAGREHLVKSGIYAALVPSP